MHTDPEILALLALGEPAGGAADRDHLAACAECRSTLDAFTGAAAAGRSSVTAPLLVAPHPRVWGQVAAAVAAERAPAAAAAGAGAAAGAAGAGAARVAGAGAAGAPGAGVADAGAADAGAVASAGAAAGAGAPGAAGSLATPDGVGPAIPDAAAVPSDRAGDPSSAHTPGASAAGRTSSGRPTRPGARRRGRRVPARWLALAAAVVLAATAGGVVTALVVRPSGAPDSPPAVTVLARAALSALPDWPGATGDAVVESDGSATSMVVSVNAATEQPGTYREVWLLSSDLTELVSLGLLVGDSGTFAIPADIDMARYSIVDVSAEPLDGNPAHSSNSILRGRLDT